MPPMATTALPMPPARKTEDRSDVGGLPLALADATEAKTPTPLYISWARLDVQSGTF